MNFPESWAECTLTAHFLPHIIKRIENNKICNDQRFPRSAAAWTVLVGPINELATCRLCPKRRDYLIGVSNVYTSDTCQDSGFRVLIKGTYFTPISSSTWNLTFHLESINQIQYHECRILFMPITESTNQLVGIE